MNFGPHNGKGKKSNCGLCKALYAMVILRTGIAFEPVGNFLLVCRQPLDVGLHILQGLLHGSLPAFRLVEMRYEKLRSLVIFKLSRDP